ncbi:hypothetical protein BN137_1214 [Cronobacter condimenti 1330]|uniref:Uncharacterized protein n=1 Tax=Cronobacter condimenti 1330 TaxID=1073999 RepID=K7ZYW3_9ENTR|nr:hypothetical protein BN137_1214 [Cronobacter condimenti 1330]
MRADDAAVSVAFFLPRRREPARIVTVARGAAIKPGFANEIIARVIFHLVARAVFVNQRDQAARQIVFIFDLMAQRIGTRQRQAIRCQLPLRHLPLRVAPGGKTLPAVKLKRLRRAVGVNNAARQAILPVVYQRTVARRVRLLLQPAIFVIAEGGGTPGTIGVADKKVGAVPGEALNARRRIAHAHQGPAIVMVIFRNAAKLIHLADQVARHVIGELPRAALHIGDAHRQVPALVVINARHLPVRPGDGSTVTALIVTVTRGSACRIGEMGHLSAHVATKPGVAARGVFVAQQLMVIVEFVARDAPQRIGHRGAVGAVLKAPLPAQAIAMRQHFAGRVVFIVMVETLHLAREAVRHHHMVAVAKLAQYLALTIPDGDEIALRRVVITAEAFGMERIGRVTDADARDAVSRVVTGKREPGEMNNEPPPGAVGYLFRLMMRVVVQR